MTTSFSRGSSTVMSRRLCSRAPLMTMASRPTSSTLAGGRPSNKCSGWYPLTRDRVHVALGPERPLPRARAACPWPSLPASAHADAETRRCRSGTPTNSPAPPRERGGRRFPEITDPLAEIASGRIAVDGRVAANPATRIRATRRWRAAVDVPLRGEAKLRAALAAFSVEWPGRVAVDCGAAAGGFTRVLLDAGARRVYAVDAGPRPAARLDPGRPASGDDGADEHRPARRPGLVPEPVDVVTLDLSYLAIALAVPQLGRLRFAAAPTWSRS